MTHPAKREVHFQAHELNSKRKEANEAILKKLTEYLQANPGMRFNQALSNLKIVEESGDYYNGMTYYWENEYYTEPMDILKRMK